MIQEGDKEFIANILGNRNIDWEKISHDNQEEGKILSELFYDIQDTYGYDTTDIFMICIDRVYEEGKHLLNVLDSDITEDVMDYLRSLRKESNDSTLDLFTI